VEVDWTAATLFLSGFETQLCPYCVFYEKRLSEWQGGDMSLGGGIGEEETKFFTL
jgi:hypothetical protein